MPDVPFCACAETVRKIADANAKLSARHIVAIRAQRKAGQKLRKFSGRHGENSLTRLIWCWISLGVLRLRENARFACILATLRMTVQKGRV